MQELAYTHMGKNNTTQTYTIVEYGNPDQFDFMKNGERVHRATKAQGKWEQADGDDIDQEVIAALGAFVDNHHQGL